MRTETKKVVFVSIKDLRQAFPFTFTKDTKIVSGYVNDYRQFVKLEVSC